MQTQHVRELKHFQQQNFRKTANVHVKCVSLLWVARPTPGRARSCSSLGITLKNIAWTGRPRRRFEVFERPCVSSFLFLLLSILPSCYYQSPSLAAPHQFLFLFLTVINIATLLLPSLLLAEAQQLNANFSLFSVCLDPQVSHRHISF